MGRHQRRASLAQKKQTIWPGLGQQSDTTRHEEASGMHSVGPGLIMLGPGGPFGILYLCLH
jgi:hypothetical protein